MATRLEEEVYGTKPAAATAPADETAANPLMPSQAPAVIPAQATSSVPAERSERPVTRLATRGAPRPPMAIVPREPHEVGSQERAIEALEDLKVIRSFVAKEMKESVDFGIVPGTGDPKDPDPKKRPRKVLFLSGAQKINMYFNVRPEYIIERDELGDGHVEFRITTNLINRVNGDIVGQGLGSCSTMETKYRYRHAARVCPECDSPSIIKGKAEFGGGFVCWKNHKTNPGCGATFGERDTRITEQEVGRIENENIHDTRNTVFKLAKKRSLVDASIGIGCLSELFTADLDDVYDLDGSQYTFGDETLTPPATKGKAEAAPKATATVAQGGPANAKGAAPTTKAPVTFEQMTRPAEPATGPTGAQQTLPVEDRSQERGHDPANESQEPPSRPPVGFEEDWAGATVVGIQVHPFSKNGRKGVFYSFSMMLPDGEERTCGTFDAEVWKFLCQMQETKRKVTLHLKWDPKGLKIVTAEAVA